MIHDNSDSKILLKKLYHNPNTFFLFDPKGHFTNAQTLFLSMKKAVAENYYGKKGKKSKENKNGIEPSLKSQLKGSAFESC
jgi:hypothetical protein